MKKIILIISIIVAQFWVTKLAAQVTHVLNPSDDTYVYSDNTIRGMEHYFKTYHSNWGSHFRRVSFLKFDISGLSAHIESVSLRLFIDDLAAGGDVDHEFQIFPVGINSWSEDEITFENYKDKVGDDITSPLLGNFIIPAGDAISAQYIEFSSVALTQMIIDSLDAGVQFFSVRMRERYSVKNPQGNGVIVDFHSKENTSGNAPELVVEEKDIEHLKASDILVDDQTVEGFDESIYRYVYFLPWDETVSPFVSATAVSEDALVSVMQAESVAGAESERTARVLISDEADTLVYSVVFELLPPPTNADLDLVLINEEPLEFFVSDQQQYLVYLPYQEDGVPYISAVTADPMASFLVSDATGIDSSLSEADRTTLITVTSANGEVEKQYQIRFYQLPHLDLVLAIGQSNMAGRAPYADYTEPMEDVYLLTPGGNMEISANPMNKHSSIRKDLGLQHLGPSYSCALTLRDSLGITPGFIVNAEGGSSITSWYEPGRKNYDGTITRALQAQKYGTFKAIIWHQGSSDNSAGLQDNFESYKSRLATMVQNLRSDLNEPDLVFVPGELSERPDFDLYNQIVVSEVSSYISNSGFITTEGTSMLSDNIHFDTPSNIILGERYAQKIIEMVYPDTSIPDTGYPNDKLFKIQTGQGFIKIDKISHDAELYIYNLNSQLVSSTSIEQDGAGFYTSLPPGLYILVLESNGVLESHKVAVL